MAQTVVSKTGLSNTETACWMLLVIGSCGLLYPVYRMRKHAAERKTKITVR
jgi:hypothetical protein